jgi:hypothetical protein
LEGLSSLNLFCHYIVSRYGSPDEASEEQKAEEFREVYLKGLPADLKTLTAVAASCGIALEENERMPRNLRGFHDVYDGGARKIYYRKGDTPSGIENTILHELREMMEPIFAEICPGYQPLRTTACHLAANRFAAAVLLPRKTFLEMVYATGLDVIFLSGLYSKSCSQILLRMGEVLQGKLFFYGALYEIVDNPEARWMVTYWTRSYNEECPEANVHGIDALFPRKGRPVASGSLVERAIQRKRACVAPHIGIVDDETADGLVAIAQPFIASGSTLSKVALVVLLQRDGKLLEPQIQHTRPIVLVGLRGHL